LLAPPAFTFAEPADKTTKKHGKKEKNVVVKNDNILGRNLATIDRDTKVGLEALYSLEYDKAIQAFSATAQHFPEDPFAQNHLMQAVLLKELFRLNALDTTLYADNGFLTGKPLQADPKVKQEITQLGEHAMSLAEARLKNNPDDVEALYARGVTRGLRLTYIALLEKSFFPSLKTAIASRNDHERVLELDPTYTDAKLVVGVHNFIVGSMPLAARIMAGVVGIRGDKKKGVALLNEVGHANCESSSDALAALMLFLRREGKYDDGLEVAKTLTARYPRNFIFALEEANLLKDSGKGELAIAKYTEVLNKVKSGSYPAFHIDRVYFGLAETLKGQRRPSEALDAYNEALKVRDSAQDLRIRALLGSGQMLDALNRRDNALVQYREVLALEPDSEQASRARTYLKQPFRYPS
jgi:tetratricopeptide (TPR) repeat protein